MRERFLFLISLSMLFMHPLGLFAQDLTGIWRGQFFSNYAGEQYKYEVQIAEYGDSLQAVTYSYRTTVFYGKATAIGKRNKSLDNIKIKELRLIELRMPSGSSACAMTCTLAYVKSGKEEFLEGNFTSVNINDGSPCGNGRVYLRRVTVSDFYTEPFVSRKLNNKKGPDPRDRVTAASPKPPAKSPTNSSNPTTPKSVVLAPKPTAPPKTNNDAVANNKKEGIPTPPASTIPPKVAPKTSAIPPVLKERTNALVKTIMLSFPEATLQLYDNGEIDNDTVSVYVNNVLVISKQRLTAQPIEVKVNLREQTIQEVVMVAENLGEIPPNTSLMVVKSGKEQYEVRITSTEQKNAVVRFEYRPKD